MKNDSVGKKTLTYVAGSVAVAMAAAPLAAQAQGGGQVRASEEYPDFYNGDTTKGIDFVKSVAVLAPAYCSSVKGDVTVVFRAPGMTHAQAFCWSGPTAEKPGKFGHDVLLADLKLGADGMGSFVFRADRFPNGPATIRIRTKDDKNKQDYCELQLYNLGGVKWNQGIPKADPPGAKGMKLVFADDFDGPLSISNDGRGARYSAHKTGGGDFSGWQFSNWDGENLPFAQRDSFLRIHASKPWGTNGRSGILSSIDSDGNGVCVPVPSYFECRFVAQSAPGTWPAFWTLTKGTIGMDKNDPGYDEIAKAGTDELDIIEAYGGYGPRNPNSGGRYHSVSHFWGQEKNPPAWFPKKLADGSDNPKYQPHSFISDTLTLGGKSSWSWTFHTYGLAITETDTIYYFDDIEIGRHPTGPVSLAQPAWFLINYSIGGISGWQIDMERYDNKSDMWVDFVRVYSGTARAPQITVDGFVGARPARVTIAGAQDGAVIRYTTDGSAPTESSARYNGPFGVSKAGTVRAAAFVPGLKASPAVSAVIETPPGIAGAIGINFGTDVDDQVVTRNERLGLGKELQANWNHVFPGKPAPALRTADGAASPVKITIGGNAKTERGEPWGFNGLEGKMKRGSIAHNPDVTFTGIPYAKYDVVVFLTAGIHTSKGNLALEKTAAANGATDSATYYFSHGWLGGQHAQAKTKTGNNPDNANYVRFTGNTADAFTLKLRSTDHWTGIAALQIIPTE